MISSPSASSSCSHSVVVAAQPVSYGKRIISAVIGLAVGALAGLTLMRIEKIAQNLTRNYKIGGCIACAAVGSVVALYLGSRSGSNKVETSGNNNQGEASSPTTTPIDPPAAQQETVDELLGPHSQEVLAAAMSSGVEPPTFEEFRVFYTALTQQNDWALKLYNSDETVSTRSRDVSHLCRESFKNETSAERLNHINAEDALLYFGEYVKAMNIFDTPMKLDAIDLVEKAYDLTLKKSEIPKSGPERRNFIREGCLEGSRSVTALLNDEEKEVLAIFIRTIFAICAIEAQQKNGIKSSKRQFMVCCLFPTRQPSTKVGDKICEIFLILLADLFNKQPQPASSSLT